MDCCVPSYIAAHRSLMRTVAHRCMASPWALSTAIVEAQIEALERNLTVVCPRMLMSY